MISEGDQIMSDVQLFPPHAEALTAMAGIPGIEIAPTIFVRQPGPEGHRGPEAAGAVLMLQATFTNPEGARSFWDAAVELMALLEHAPGFIRRYSFPDGPSMTLIALWRTLEDAKAYAATPAHRAAVRELYRHRWQNSHYSALFALQSSHGRVIFCDTCDGVTPAEERVCNNCGAALNDIFAAEVH
jgi:heme-degrading monooxygenase HmoA